MPKDKPTLSMDFADWSEITTTSVNAHELRVLVIPDDKFRFGCESVAAVVPSHYAAPARIADILKMFGKGKAAQYLRNKLPSLRRIRSGDLGEVLATEYIRGHTFYVVPINRLRWKDHRNMPLRGDDVIGISIAADDEALSFLKCEVKSRKSLSANVVKLAREALNANGGMPSPHALAYISDRLHEMGQDDLSDRILGAQLQAGISANQVEHLLFTFSANAPEKLLRNDLEAYDGNVHEVAVGLHATKHQEFIAAVYELVEIAGES